MRGRDDAEVWLACGCGSWGCTALLGGQSQPCFPGRASTWSVSLFHTLTSNCPQRQALLPSPLRKLLFILQNPAQVVPCCRAALLFLPGMPQEQGFTLFIVLAPGPHTE